MHLLRLLTCLFFVGYSLVIWAVEEPFTADLQSELYDIQFSITANKPLPADSRFSLALESGDNGDALRVSITPKEIILSRGVTPIKLIIAPGASKNIFLLRRGDQFSIRLDDKLLFSNNIPRGLGGEGIVTESRGFTLGEIEVTRLEPVIFADDFMRNKEDIGSWRTFSGEWGLQTAWDSDPHGKADYFNKALYAQNPFAWLGKAEKGAAVCLAGEARWEDYQCSAAIRPENGAVGLLVNVTEDNIGILARWSSAGDRSSRGDRLTLERWEAGTSRVLAEVRGGYIPGQWYRISMISSQQGVSVLIDGEERLQLKALSPWRGAVGLYSESSIGSTFDDITVYGSTINQQLLAESTQTQIQQRFLRDNKGMREWAMPEEWHTKPDGVQVNLYNYYGNQWMRVLLMAQPMSGKLEMTLAGDGSGTEHGYRAQIIADQDKKEWRYRIIFDDALLAEKVTKMPAPNEEMEIRFFYRDGALSLEVDDNPVVSAVAPQQSNGTRPAYKIQGALGRITNILMMGDQFRDYTFTEAPIDWISEGNWMPTVRWACQPQWSFYSGWSRGDAVLWHKQYFTGDHSMQVYLGFKMEYPRERTIYEESDHYHDVNITICGDGHDPRSGYTMLSGQPDEFGRPSSATVLLRNGAEVQRVNASVYGFGMGHRSWHEVELRLRGDVVEGLVDGAVLIRYRDPAPLPGGSPAIWTSDMGISVARARLRYANLPKPRHDTQVTLDTPWFPEWFNVAQSYNYDFPGAWSTDGKPVTLSVMAQLAPEGAVLPLVKKSTMIYTPNKIGEFWYKLNATTGKDSSPAFNLFGQVFDPALGRDDSHTLILYYFNEKAGEVVHDRSAIGPAADLQVPAYPNSRWLPEQGVNFSGPQPLQTAGAVEKLMAIARNQACTVEFWVSNDTAYFPNNWLGCMFTWEKDSEQRNLLVGGFKANFVAAPFGARFDPAYDDNSPNFNGAYAPYLAFRTSLHHLVINWNGRETRAFLDGKSFPAGQINWNTDKWLADARLLLGNRSDGKRLYLGSYYLFAIHDKALTDEEVLRNYHAGPSARWQR